MSVTFEIKKDPLIPAIIRTEKGETPIWVQVLWPEGPDTYYIHHNGCGHCCAAMAARLHGVTDIDPAKEYARCLALWGEPSGKQDHFQTVFGIESVLKSFGVPATAFGVPLTEPEEGKVRARILKALSEEKQVIFWSHPVPGKEEKNPFSRGEHYVMACGYDADGHIVIANSSGDVQLCSIETIMDCLFYGSEPSIRTWGEDDRLEACGGVVIVG